eukprot:CAMPEP_0114623936 /NCGR_PEP_ID=MMETSP0168-20121206/10508_1 /TAXON_ID=95228 ORGANISM="Vannella sp., Strain DIVA3 517/6/12" /NCGR_SAMPLE_ID=MMETSP0168 /ASSEMBLY_ACC=CAM_ASM_000044 /LENGTH=703 /DNA_ID=CAMNT_0001835195 /DNA_START=59 /DNA_END=2167 /DNA_ORIENTATION=-
MRVQRLFDSDSDDGFGYEQEEANCYDDDFFSDPPQQQQQVQKACNARLAPPPPVTKASVPAAAHGGEVELRLQEYLALCKAAERRKSAPAQLALVERASYRGEQAHDAVQLDAHFLVSFLSDDWVCVELLPDTVSVTSHAVARVAAEASALEPRAELGVARGQLCLFGRGRCHLRGGGAPSLSLPEHAGRELLPLGAHGSAEHPRLEAALRSSLRVFDAEGESGGALRHHTEITAELRPTETLAVQWKRALDEADLEEQPKGAQEGQEGAKETPVVAVAREIITNAEQHTVHSIGEGIVLSSVTYKFEILHASRSVFEFDLPTSARVLSVEGTAVKRWDVLEAKGKATAATLKVSLEYAMEAHYSLELRTELKMASTSCDVQLPRFACRQVNREQGFLGVEARTSVEVSELQATMLAPMGISELPAEVAAKAVNPLLFGYKFLVGGASELRVRVKKHKDVPVLVALVEACHVAATLEENKLMYTVTLRVRNTQTQFLRLSLPDGAVVWSTLVAGKPVKPARDTDNSQLMIPLQKSSSNHADACFVVEAVFLQTLAASMNKEGGGRLELALAPVVDLPINELFVSLFLPNGYDYGPFATNMREVHHFSGTPPLPTSAPAPAKPKVAMAKKRKSLFGGGGGGSSKQRACVTPVRVQMCTGGHEFRFEQLLVAQETFAAAVSYRKERRLLDVRRDRRRFRAAVAGL